MVHSSGLHALPGAPLGCDRAQDADSPALRGPQPDPHPKRLGEEQRRGRQQESTVNVALKCNEKLFLALSYTVRLSHFTTYTTSLPHDDIVPNCLASHRGCFISDVAVIIFV